jgi:hypothetical protein
MAATEAWAETEVQGDSAVRDSALAPAEETGGMVVEAVLQDPARGARAGTPLPSSFQGRVPKRCPTADTAASITSVSLDSAGAGAPITNWVKRNPAILASHRP